VAGSCSWWCLQGPQLVDDQQTYNNVDLPETEQRKMKILDVGNREI